MNVRADMSRFCHGRVAATQRCLTMTEMYVTIWRFVVPAEHAAEFERHYGADGTWAALFRTSSDYLGTELFASHDAPGTYLTLDSWTSRAAYESFRAAQADAYRQLDARMGTLTTSEEHAGGFER